MREIENQDSGKNHPDYMVGQVKGQPAEEKNAVDPMIEEIHMQQTEDDSGRPENATMLHSGHIEDLHHRDNSMAKEMDRRVQIAEARIRFQVCMADQDCEGTEIVITVLPSIDSQQEPYSEWHSCEHECPEAVIKVDTRRVTHQGPGVGSQ